MRAMADALRAAVLRYYPDATSNPEYTSVINDRHHRRLASYLDDARSRGVEVISIGSQNSSDRRFPPTILIDPPDDASVMREEIFGPILPLKSYRTLAEAIAYVNARPRPLALYLFASSRRDIERVLTCTIAGGVCVNDTLLHVAAEDLPFGGVGASGMGHYHGQEGFDTFSKLKPVFERHGLSLGRSLRPPYSGLHDWMRRILIR